MRYVYRQGSLDSFCGFYAVVNAVASLLEDHCGIASNRDTFYRIARKAYFALSAKQIARLCDYGTNWKDVRDFVNILEAAIRTTPRLKQASLSFKKTRYSDLRAMETALEPGPHRYYFFITLKRSADCHCVAAKLVGRHKKLAWLDSADYEEYGFPAKLSGFSAGRRTVRRHDLCLTVGKIEFQRKGHA